MGKAIHIWFCSVVIILMVILAFGCSGGAVAAQTNAAQPNVGLPYQGFGAAERVEIVGYDGDAMEPFITRDGRYLLFNNRNDPAINTDLHYAKYVSPRSFQYKGLIIGANTGALEGTPTMDAAGNLYFVSTRSYDKTASTIYRARFAAGTAEDVALLPNVSLERGGMVNFDVDVSADGNTMIINDSRFDPRGFPKTSNLVLASREGNRFQRREEASKFLFQNVNSEHLEYAQCLSNNGLELYFTRVEEITLNAEPKIYISQRQTLDEPFGVPRELAAAHGFVEAVTVTPSGNEIYFHRKEGERYVIYHAMRDPG